MSPPSNAEISWSVSEGGNGATKQAYWKTVVAKDEVPIDFRVRDWQVFRATRRLRMLGAQRFSLTETSAFEARVAGARSEFDKPPPVFVVLMLQGKLNIMQEGISVQAGSGKIVLIDAGKLHRVSCSELSRFIILELGSDQLPPDTVRGLDGAPAILDAEVPAAAIAAQLLKHLWRLPPLTTEAGARLSEQIATIVAEGVHKAIPQREALTAHRLAMVTRAKRIVAKNMNDPDFSATRLARIMGITTKHLTTLFQSVGQTPADHIRRMRLHAAWDALTDDRDTAPIADIALRTGFSDAASFARALKKAYGYRPSQIRKFAWS